MHENGKYVVAVATNTAAFLRNAHRALMYNKLQPTPCFVYIYNRSDTAPRAASKYNIHTTQPTGTIQLELAIINRFYQTDAEN